MIGWSYSYIFFNKPMGTTCVLWTTSRRSSVLTRKFAGTHLRQEWPAGPCQRKNIPDWKLARTLFSQAGIVSTILPGYKLQYTLYTFAYFLFCCSQGLWRHVLQVFPYFLIYSVLGKVCILCISVCVQCFLSSLFLCVRKSTFYIYISLFHLHRTTGNKMFCIHFIIFSYSLC